jgi:hypothetical protein
LSVKNTFPPVFFNGYFSTECGDPGLGKTL